MTQDKISIRNKIIISHLLKLKFNILFVLFLIAVYSVSALQNNALSKEDIK